jgi:hypothetical protein
MLAGRQSQKDGIVNLLDFTKPEMVLPQWPWHSLLKTFLSLVFSDIEKQLRCTLAIDSYTLF